MSLDAALLHALEKLAPVRQDEPLARHTTIGIGGPADAYVVSAESLESWAQAGWVDLREPNMGLWKGRFDRIEAEIGVIPRADTSSRFLRDRQFWSAEGLIQPGKIAGWIFGTEEKGARMK